VTNRLHLAGTEPRTKRQTGRLRSAPIPFADQFTQTSKEFGPVVRQISGLGFKPLALGFFQLATAAFFCGSTGQRGIQITTQRLQLNLSGSIARLGIVQNSLQ
jgi:hypothetical protein